MVNKIAVILSIYIPNVHSTFQFINKVCRLSPSATFHGTMKNTIIGKVYLPA